ncbi:MAG: sulfatase-like hydrolase/transferase [bacterium]
MIKRKNKELIIISFIFGLSLGFIELAINILFEPSGFIPFISIITPLLLTIGVYFFIVIALRSLATYVKRSLRVEEITSFSAMALFLGTVFTLASPYDLLVQYIVPILRRLPHLSIPVHDLSIFVNTVFFVLVWVFLASKAIAYKSRKDAAPIFTSAFPFIFAETILFVSLQKRWWIDSYFSSQSLLFTFAYLFITLLTLGLCARIKQKNTLRKLWAVYAIFIILSPLSVSIFKHMALRFSDKHTSKNHRMKHVILIIADTLRADALSCYGSQDVHTPHIDQLAEDGILFKKAISSAPWTLPSVVSIMTGISPFVHKTIGADCKLSDSFTTLAEYMQNDGYLTMAIGSNMFLNPMANVSQGFSTYNFFPKLWALKCIGGQILGRLSPTSYPPKMSASDLNKIAINWLESNQNHEKDFFLWVHYFDAHLPYDPPRDCLPPGKSPLSVIDDFFLLNIRGGHFAPTLSERAEIRDLYLGEVRSIDKNIGKLLTSLKEMKLYDDSLIIFTSDHGEEFWEHDNFEHGHTVYNELLHVPLIIKLPSCAGKKQIDKPVPIQNIMPTVLDLASIGYKKDSVSSVPLTPLWGPDPDSYGDQPIISTGVLYYGDRESMMYDDMKYIHHLVTDKEELYNLAHDPGEQFSLTFISPDKVQEARKILKQNREMLSKYEEYYSMQRKIQINQDKAVIQRLKSLGYLH